MPLLPFEYISSVGLFVMFDHATIDKHTHGLSCHIQEHPHKGMASLTYVVNGGVNMEPVVINWWHGGM